MGVEKCVLRRGNGIDVPKKHDEVAMEYTGYTISSPTKLLCLTKLQAGFTTTNSQTRKASSEYHEGAARTGLTSLNLDSTLRWAVAIL
jgi:hypothetical protein